MSKALCSSTVRFVPQKKSTVVPGLDKFSSLHGAFRFLATHGPLWQPTSWKMVQWTLRLVYVKRFMRLNYSVHVRQLRYHGENHATVTLFTHSFEPRNTRSKLQYEIAFTITRLGITTGADIVMISVGGDAMVCLSLSSQTSVLCRQLSCIHSLCAMLMGLTEFNCASFESTRPERLPVSAEPSEFFYRKGAAGLRQNHKIETNDLMYRSIRNSHTYLTAKYFYPIYRHRMHREKRWKRIFQLPK